MNVSKFISIINSDGFAKKYSVALLTGYALLTVSGPALAQNTDLHSVGVSIFTAIYAAVGVVCAIALLFTGVNWACGGILMGGHDPKKMFFQAMIGTGLALSVVAIIAGIKAVAASAGSISSL